MERLSDIKTSPEEMRRKFEEAISKPELERGVLYPIEQAPEGVLLQLWWDNAEPLVYPYVKLPDGKFRREVLGNESIITSEGVAKFCLWPKPAQPKHSWDEYTDEDGFFRYWDEKSAPHKNVLHANVIIPPDISEDVARAAIGFLNQLHPKED